MVRSGQKHNRGGLKSSSTIRSLNTLFSVRCRLLKKGETHGPLTPAVLRDHPCIFVGTWLQDLAAGSLFFSMSDCATLAPLVYCYRVLLSRRLRGIDIRISIAIRRLFD
jgi:hypothetical protein